MTTMTRQLEIRDLWKQYQGLYVMAGVLIGLLLFPFLELIINDLSQLLIGLVPEAIGIGFTVGIIEQFNRQRAKREQAERDQLQKQEQAERDQRQQREQQTRDQLQSISDLRRAGTSQDRQPIIDRMGKSKLFRGADLGQADLSEANLGQADLEEAILTGVELEGAYLWEANLKGVDLEYVILVNAILVNANLSGAILVNANLEGAILADAILEGATLWNANLKGADLVKANLENIIWKGKDRHKLPVVPTLPDGEEWTSDTDMKRFTDREHPEYKATREKINAIREEMGLGSLYL
jgi:uncharacterized protein YjbI with pentapeptide repeats